MHKNKKYQIEKDIIERNSEFLSKKNEKLEKRKQEELHAYSFSPNLAQSKSNKQFFGKNQANFASRGSASGSLMVGEESKASNGDTLV